MDDPVFPPLLSGEAVPHGTDPFTKAIAAATVGSDPGVIYHDAHPHALEAAIILAPEAPLEDAMAMVLVAAIGLADALGALAPPEVGVHFLWPCAAFASTAPGVATYVPPPRPMIRRQSLIGSSSAFPCPSASKMASNRATTLTGPC